jgi:hypothetical protein
MKTASRWTSRSSSLVPSSQGRSGSSFPGSADAAPARLSGHEQRWAQLVRDEPGARPFRSGRRAGDTILPRRPPVNPAGQFRATSQRLHHWPPSRRRVPNHRGRGTAPCSSTSPGAGGGWRPGRMSTGSAPTTVTPTTARLRGRGHSRPNSTSSSTAASTTTGPSRPTTRTTPGSARPTRP